MNYDDTIGRLTDIIEELDESGNKTRAQHELILLRENLIGHREAQFRQKSEAGRRGMEVRWGKRTTKENQ